MLWRETPVLHSRGDHRNPSHTPHPPQRCPFPKIQTRHLTSGELPPGHVTAEPVHHIHTAFQIFPVQEDIILWS